MTKPRDYDRTHRRTLAAIETRIDRIFRKAAGEAARIGVSVKAPLPEGKIFSFDDYPAARKEAEALLADLRDSVETVIVNGVRSAWTLSNNKNNALVSRVFGDNARRLSKEQERRYYSTNGAALDAFLGRKSQGLGLSERVWRYADAFRSEIEMGLDLGIRTGEDAARMARSLRQYLRHPDKLFRRVRDQHGNLRLSKAAKAYHPGRGVYRSSYRNARRLAVTEVNMAYHTADHMRWRQMDFVVGIEIRLSGNHTVNGLPLTDICDELAGRYPKDFKFTGWHPHCRCHAVAVLKTEKEMAEDTKRILRGEQPKKGSVNEVRYPPAAFGTWIEDNADRIERAEKNGTVPYFIADNRETVKGILEGKKRDADSTNQNDAIEASAKRVEEVANIIIKNGYHSSREAQMPPLNIGTISSVITDYAEKNQIDLDSHDLYITTKGIEHTLRESKELKGIAVTVNELVNFVKNRNDYAIYYDPAMGDFIFATSKAKLIVRPNFKMKINKEKKSVFNYISATRIIGNLSDNVGGYIKIKDAKQ